MLAWALLYVDAEAMTKKKNEKRALSLRTETISNLSTDTLRSVNGGWTTIVISTAAQWTTIMSGTATLLHLLLCWNCCIRNPDKQHLLHRY